jgi:hypothetical protein
MENKNLKQIRQSLRLNNHEAALMFGISDASWAQYENGKRPIPKWLWKSIDWYLQSHDVNKPVTPVMDSLIDLDAPAIKQQMKRRIALSGAESEAWNGLCTKKQYDQWKNRNAAHAVDWEKHVKIALDEHALLGLLIDPHIKIDLIRRIKDKVDNGEASLSELIKLFDWLPASASSPFFLPTPRAMPKDTPK